MIKNAFAFNFGYSKEKTGTRRSCGRCLHVRFGTRRDSAEGFVAGVDGAQLFKGVDLFDVLRGALADVDVIGVLEGHQRHVAPVLVLAAGHIEGSLDVVFQRGAVLGAPVGDAQHPVAVLGADAQLIDHAVLTGLKVPVIVLLGGDAQIGGVIEVFIKDGLVVDEEIGFQHVGIPQVLTREQNRRDVVAGGVVISIFSNTLVVVNAFIVVSKFGNFPPDVS